MCSSCTSTACGRPCSKTPNAGSVAGTCRRVLRNRPRPPNRSRRCRLVGDSQRRSRWAACQHHRLGSHDHDRRRIDGLATGVDRTGYSGARCDRHRNIGPIAIAMAQPATGLGGGPRPLRRSRRSTAPTACAHPPESRSSRNSPTRQTGGRRTQTRSPTARSRQLTADVGPRGLSRLR